MAARAKRRVQINVFGHSGPKLSTPWLRKVVSRTLQRVLPEKDCQVSLVIADDVTVRCLNRDYRGLDELTDVLAFSTSHGGQWEGKGEPPGKAPQELSFVMPAQEPQHLGEVIISYPQVVQQAREHAVGIEDELALLIVHGVLHLVGFDHRELQQEAEMRAKEQEILCCINLGRARFEAGLR